MYLDDKILSAEEVNQLITAFNAQEENPMPNRSKAVMFWGCLKWNKEELEKRFPGKQTPFGLWNPKEEEELLSMMLPLSGANMCPPLSRTPYHKKAPFWGLCHV